MISEEYNIDTTAIYSLITDNKFSSKITITEVNQIGMVERNNFFLFRLSRYSPNNADPKILKKGNIIKLIIAPHMQ